MVAKMVVDNDDPDFDEIVRLGNGFAEEGAQAQDAFARGPQRGLPLAQR